MLGLLLGAVTLGIIISAMEGDFPEFLPLLGCVIAVFAASFVAGLLIGPTDSLALAVVPPVAGAVAGGVTISALLGMELKRAWIAAGIYLLVQVTIALTILFAFG